MNGRVSDELVPLLPVRVFNRDGGPVEVTATLDTGFNGKLTLPQDILEKLERPATGSRRLRIGNGTWVWLSTHEVELEWDGNSTWVTCLATPNCHLLGMSVLLGYSAFVQAMPGGEVEIQPLFGESVTD